MKKILVGLLTVICVCTPAIHAQADDPAFTIAWSMFFPRSTYFIGETITFQVEAYAESSPLLKVPDQYANIAIFNESMFEVYNYWVYTDTNGSAWVNWTTQLDYSNGTYTVVLTDGFGALVTTELTLLWDQNIVWQRQLDDLRLENDYLWGYLDDLYGSRNYLLRQNTAKTHQLVYLSFLCCITFVAAIWVAVREYIRVSARTENSKRSSVSSLLGFRNVPFYSQTTDHPVAGNYTMPDRHRPPRFGEDHYCPICEPKAKSIAEAKLKMTEHQWQEHMQDYHDRKLLGFKAWVKKRRFRDDLRALYGEEESPRVIESLKPQNIVRAQLVKKVEELKAQTAKGEITKLEARQKMDEFRVSLGLNPRYSDNEPVHKRKPSRKPEKPSPAPELKPQLPQVRERRLKVY